MRISGWILMFRRIPLTADEEGLSDWNSEQEVSVRLNSQGVERGKFICMHNFYNLHQFIIWSFRCPNLTNLSSHSQRAL